MENNEGKILKNLIKGKGLEMNDVARLLGMSRQNLNYHLRKVDLDEDFKGKVKTALTITIPPKKEGESNSLLNNDKLKNKGTDIESMANDILNLRSKVEVLLDEVAFLKAAPPKYPKEYWTEDMDRKSKELFDKLADNK